MNDILRAFHHPALRDENIEIQRDMFKTVKMWADQHPRRNELERLLSSESVKNGKNHILNQQGSGGGKRDMGGHSCGSDGGHGKVSGSLWSQVRTRDLDAMQGSDGDASANYVSPSPAPPGSHSPPSGGYNYNQGPGYQGGNQQPPQGGYNAPPPPNQYYQSGYNQAPPQGYPGPAGPGYGAPPPGPGYGAPPPGQWNAPPPGYGGPGYGPPQGYGPGPGGPPGQYPPYQQGPPPGQGPPGWNQYPGQGPRY